MLAAVLAFAAVAAVINVTPGLDTMLVLRTSVSGGRAVGLASGLGVTVGCLAWGTAAAAGITELLAASRLGYDAVRIAGAAYLTWLGCAALWRSRPRRGAPAGAMPAGTAGAPRTTAGAAFRSGVITNLLNPKAGVFYMSLLPQFIPHGAPVLPVAMLLTLIDVAELLVWFGALSAAAAALTRLASRESFRRGMERVSGLVFLGFAVNLAVERQLSRGRLPGLRRSNRGAL